MPTADTDDQLLHRLAQGDAGAFEQLFLRHYGIVYRVAYGLVGRRDVAEDLAQDTFLKLYRQPPKHGDTLSLPAWLCRVVLNRGHNAIRSERRAANREERVAFQGWSTGGDWSDPEAAALRNEQQNRVRDALAQLPERQMKLLLLRNAGLSYPEIARLLDLAPGSIGTLMARAGRAFQQAYSRSDRATTPARSHAECEPQLET
jgi:RNA polymerase sigma-70 factor (ECF subfamily)